MPRSVDDIIREVLPMGHMQPATFGKRVDGLIVETYGRGRQCCWDGCRTILSQYNSGSYCSTHEELKRQEAQASLERDRIRAQIAMRRARERFEADVAERREAAARRYDAAVAALRGKQAA